MDPQKLYTYKRLLRTNNAQPAVFIEGQIDYVRSFITGAEFMELFGGSFLSVDSSGEKYKGVWGKRNVLFFRRLLRERGAVFEVVKISASERTGAGHTTR
jgi:hypothetical protein